MKEITTDNFDFEKLRKSNALYVDKTRYVWELVHSATSIYFLSRPRRFGKSLLLSTLKAYFLGKRDLFDGLAIERLADEDWETWPVIHLDMAQASSREGLEGQRKALDCYIARVADELGLQVANDMAAPAVLLRLIDYLTKLTGKQVVVLIDEYDKPILDALHTDYVANVVGMMQTFYQVVKSNVAKERFVFITGVSKFSHTSLFSGMNNPTDITQEKTFATMLGYTEEELRDNFADHIDRACQQTGLDRDALLTKVKAWYDGFRFTSAPATVYNPVSVGLFFRNYEFRNYWYATGTPTFLIAQMRNDPFRMDYYTQQWVDMQAFDKFDALHIDGFSLAVQTGYLTIKEVVSDELGTSYRYDFPNEEIRLSWSNDMVWMATNGQVLPARQSRSLLTAFRNGETARLMEQLQQMFAGVTKEKLGQVHEGYYRNMLFLLFTAFGLAPRAEEQVAGGRIDLAVEAYGQAYVFELKVSANGEASEVERLLTSGLDQANRKHYADKYHFSAQTTHVVAVVFEHTNHQLVAWREKC